MQHVQLIFPENLRNGFKVLQNSFLVRCLFFVVLLVLLFFVRTFVTCSK